jgi:hypothetical protein
MSRHVPTAQWYLALNTAINSTSLPTTNTEGVSVPNGKVNEWGHLFVSANAACSVKVVGMTSAKVAAGFDTIGQQWGRLEDYSTPDAGSLKFAEPIRGVTAYERLSVIRTDQNANVSVNAYIGLCEQWRGL